LGKRLIERINREEFIFNQSVLEWTISIGVSGSRGCQDVDDLLKKADIALYKSKQVRNMVIQEA
jgi:PleD family two-component response regulator